VSPKIPHTVSGTFFYEKKVTVSEKYRRKFPTPSVVHFFAKKGNRIRKVPLEIPITPSAVQFFTKKAAPANTFAGKASRGTGGVRGGENNLEFPAGTYQTETAARKGRNIDGVNATRPP
jgi:hypothetical protein